MEERVRYGVGEQSFEVMRSNGFIYVDKTRYIETIIRGSQYYFLGRPRRFGKSLFLSTLKCFFEGKRKLFKGLYIDTIDWDWQPYPVLYMDLNVEKYKDRVDLRAVVSNMLDRWEKEYGVTRTSDNVSIRFSNIIRGAYETTGKRVVILVDEYDKPLVGSLHDAENFDYYRNELAALYSNFKSSADYLRLVFMTGVSRFGHLSVFSGLNNILDVSFDDRYSAVCGISETELVEYFDAGINSLVARHCKSREEILSDLKSWYDGYRFSCYGEDMYNPYSIVCVMDSKEFRNYWIRSGQPTLLVEQLKRMDVSLKALLNTECSVESLIGLDLDRPSPIALVYQTGYLTIKEYDKEFDLVTLGLPNKEVTDGFMRYLLPNYVNMRDNTVESVIKQFMRDLVKGDADAFMKRLQSFFSSVSYEMRIDDERNFHNALLILMKLIGLYVDAEYRTSDGRIDILLQTDRFIYIIELKSDHTAEAALRQIDNKHYELPFVCDGRKIIKIGVNFSTKMRTIKDWLIKD